MADMFGFDEIGTIAVVPFADEPLSDYTEVSPVKVTYFPEKKPNGQWDDVYGIIESYLGAYGGGGGVTYDFVTETFAAGLDLPLPSWDDIINFLRGGALNREAHPNYNFNRDDVVSTDTWSPTPIQTFTRYWMPDGSFWIDFDGNSRPDLRIRQYPDGSYWGDSNMDGNFDTQIVTWTW